MSNVRRQLAPLLVLLVVIGAVIGVAALRERADDERRAELLLVRLDGLTQEQYALVGRAVAEREADDELLADVRASRAAFDAALGALAVLGESPVTSKDLAGLEAASPPSGTRPTMRCGCSPGASRRWRRRKS